LTLSTDSMAIDRLETFKKLTGKEKKGGINLKL
jgi:hypothetical protein